jgi:hypothetical protein
MDLIVLGLAALFFLLTVALIEYSDRLTGGK